MSPLHPAQGCLPEPLRPTQTWRAAIRRAQKAGATISAIARELDISRQRVYQLLERG